MTERLFLADSRLLEFDATVVARREHEGRPAVVLDRTAFYAESGGQPGDTGRLGEALVLDVLERGGEVLHVLDRPIAAERVRGVVDGERRRDHVQQHHGQHLLSKAFVEVARAETVAFHLGRETTTIDLGRPVTAGTHPRTTAEVGAIVITALEKYKVGTRVFFVCGRRALDAVARRQAILDGLVSTLSAPLDDLVAAARKAKDDLVEAEKRAKDLLERALEGEARKLLAQARGDGPPATPASPALVVAAYDGWPPGDLRVLATRLVALAPCVALLGSRADKAHLVFAQSEGLSHDVGALLRSALEPLGGKGGGRGNIAQGGGERPDLLDEALVRAAQAVRDRA